MNYIEVLNRFWKLRRSKRITNLQADLYYFLLNESSGRGNGSNWENPFQCANGLVCTSIGISEKALIDARNVLQQIGLIQVEPGVTKQKPPKYYLLDYCTKVSNPVSIGGGIEVGNPVSNKVGNGVYINNQTKQKETKDVPQADLKTETQEKPVAPPPAGWVSPQQYAAMELTEGETQFAQQAWGSPKASPETVRAMWVEFKGINASNGSHEGVTGIYRHFKHWLRRQQKPAAAATSNRLEEMARQQELRRDQMFKPKEVPNGA